MGGPPPARAPDIRGGVVAPLPDMAPPPAKAKSDKADVSPPAKAILLPQVPRQTKLDKTLPAGETIPVSKLLGTVAAVCEEVEQVITEGMVLPLPPLPPAIATICKSVEKLHLDQGFDEVSKLSKPTGDIKFSKGTAIGVGQHELARTNAKSPKPILGSVDATICVIVAIYDRGERVASLAHLDAATPNDELLRMITLMRGHSSTKPLEIHIAGGNGWSQEKVSKLIELIRKQSNVRIVTADIGPDGGPSHGWRKLAIDSRTGEVTTSFSYEQLEYDPDRSDQFQKDFAKHDRKPYPLQFVYDTRKNSLEK